MRDFGVKTLKGVSAVCVTKRLDYNYNKITTRPNYRRRHQDISVLALQLRHYKLTRTIQILSGTMQDVQKIKYDDYLRNFYYKRGIFA